MSVERVARAIDKCAQDRGHPLHAVVVRHLAVAAIEALREPSDEQRNAYYELSHKTEVMVDAHWERAIDAALGQGAK